MKNLGFFILAGAFAFVFITSRSVDHNPEVIYVQPIDSENSDKEILQELRDRGVIKNPFTYYFLLAASKLDKEIQPGGYFVTKNMGAVALYSELSDPTYKQVAIQEGWRKEQVAREYGAALGWPDWKTKEFETKYPVCEIAGREGRLYPGEYLVSKNATVQTVKQEMEKKFDEVFSDVASPRVEKLAAEHAEIPLDEQIVIVASLIQREAAGKHDMRLISGIIWNRIEVGMPLQIDATLQYVKGNDDRWWPIVKSEDKFLNSPFNTYLESGLPPSPIANPGRAALEAAANPASTDCIFYIHDRYRTIHCSPTYEGHLQNIRNHL